MGLAYCIQTLKTVSRENGLSVTTSAPLKMAAMDLFPKTIASLNSYRNARITTTLNLLTLHILYNSSHWQLRILAPLKTVTGGPLTLSPSPPPPPPNHATAKHHIIAQLLIESFNHKYMVDNFNIFHLVDKGQNFDTIWKNTIKQIHTFQFLEPISFK